MQLWSKLFAPYPGFRPRCLQHDPKEDARPRQMWSRRLNTSGDGSLPGYCVIARAGAVGTGRSKDVPNCHVGRATLVKDDKCGAIVTKVCLPATSRSLMAPGAQTSIEDAIANVPDHLSASATAQQRPWRSHTGKTTSVAPSTQLSACRRSLGAKAAGSATITSFAHHPCQRPSILAKSSKLISNRRRNRGKRRHHRWQLLQTH